MKYRIIDRKYHFMSFFDTETGAYLRTGILDENGRDTGVDPFMGSFPNLIDVGVMGHCIHGKTGLCAKAGIGCYQSGLTVEKPNMSVDNFRWIAEQCRHKSNQFALGGRGDPDQHEHFEELLQICRENDIVPNFTTSGYGMTRQIAQICKKYCGAVAVSWYRSEYTTNAIQMLLEAGVKNQYPLRSGQQHHRRSHPAASQRRFSKRHQRDRVSAAQARRTGNTAECAQCERSEGSGFLCRSGQHASIQDRSGQLQCSRCDPFLQTHSAPVAGHLRGGAFQLLYRLRYDFAALQL